MDFPGKLLKVTIPVQAPMSLKPEKEEKEGFTTPKGAEFRIPSQLECPPAPERRIHQKTIDKRSKKSAGRRIISVNVQDLDTVFARTQVANVVEDS